MKKLICLLLMLLFVPLVSFAEFTFNFNNQPEEYVGCWAVYIPDSFTHHGDNAFIYVFNADGTMSAFYSLNNSDDSSVHVYTTTGKWSEMNGAIVFQSDGKDTYGLLEIHDDTIFFDFSGASFGLQKIPLPDITRIIYPDMSAVVDE